jgi:PiT family inorganic phosphate transporter
MVCNFKGLEISVTHSIVGSILGYGIATYGISGVRWGIVQNVAISFFTSPLLAVAGAFLLCKLLATIAARYTIITRGLPVLLIISLCYSAFAFGTNDIANATGVYVTVATMALGNNPEYNIMLLLTAFGSLGIAVGGFWLGPKVIEMVAFRITRLNPVMATAAEIANALVVHLFVTVSFIVSGYGIPVSSSLAGVGSLVGVGLASYGSTGFNRRTVALLFSSWTATVLITLVITYIVYSIIFPFTGPIIKPEF